MSLLNRLPGIMEDSREIYLKAKEELPPESYCLSEIFRNKKEPDEDFNNMLAWGENLSFMKFLSDKRDLLGKIDLIYIDPPFFTKANYKTEVKLMGKDTLLIPALNQKAYPDIWEGGIGEYLCMLIPRLLFMRDLLKDEGSIWVHLDWHAAHYVKIILDELFGEENFVNEIIWHYKSGGASKRSFAKKHDTLLFYSRSKDYYFEPMQEKSYNRGFKPYRFKGVKEYKDELGWYTMVNRKDVWLIDMVGRTSTERTGYVTQKPEALIERILESCTKKGAICADFFGGSGTMAAAADRMGRKWISCDMSRSAFMNSQKRLVLQGADFDVYEAEGQSEGGILKAEATITSTGLSNTKMLRVKLLDYRINPDVQIPVKKKYIPEIKRVMKEDSLALLAYWSVDCHYKSPVIRPQAFFSRDRNSLESVYETIGTDFGSVGIKAMDLFGNSSFFEIKPLEKQ